MVSYILNKTITFNIVAFTIGAFITRILHFRMDYYPPQNTTYPQHPDATFHQQPRNLPFKTELCNKFSETGFCRCKSKLLPVVF